MKKPEFENLVTLSLKPAKVEGRTSTILGSYPSVSNGDRCADVLEDVSDRNKCAVNRSKVYSQSQSIHSKIEIRLIWIN
jgi:hypothetical protein